MSSFDFDVGVVLEARRYEQGARRVERANRGMRSSTDRVERSVDRLERRFGRLKQFLVGLGLAAVLTSIVNAGLDLERIQSTLRAGVGAQQAGAELSFLRQEAERLGLVFAPLADQYAKLSAASRGTALEGEGVRQIFQGVSEAAAVLRLRGDQVEGAFRAIEQMVSKGKVQAEELRGQLGERLPGAFQLAASAIGVTTAQLDTMLERGEVTADRLLPALAAKLREVYGPHLSEAVNSRQADINRFFNALRRGQEVLADELLPVVARVARNLATFLTENRSQIAGWGKALFGALGLVVPLLKLLLDNVELLVPALGAWLAFNAAQWLMATAAASKVAAVATLDWSTAVWAVRSGYAKLVAMDMVSKLRAISISTGLLAGGVAALGLALNKLVDDWKANLDQQRSAIVAGNQVNVVMGQVRKAIAAGSVSTTLFAQLNSEGAKLRDHLRELETQLGRQKNGARIQEIQQQIEETSTAIGATETWIEKARGLVVALDEASGSGGGGGAAGLTKAMIESRIAILDHSIAVAKEVEQMEALQAASEQGAERYALVSAAIERGIEPAQLANRQLELLLKKLLNLKQLEANDLALDELIEGSVAETVSRIEQAIPDQLEMPELDTSALDLSMEYWVGDTLPEYVEAAGKELDKLASRERAEKLQGVYDNFLEGLQRQFASTFQDIFTNGISSFADLWDGVKKLAIQTLSEVAAAWAAKKFSLNIDASSGGGFSSLFGGGNNAGAALLPFAVAVGGYLWSQSRQEQRDSQRYGAGASIGGDITGLTGSPIAPGTSQQVREVTEAVERAVRSTLDAMGALAGELPQLGVRVRNDGGEFIAEVGGIALGAFTTFEQALSAAVQAGFQQGSFQGLGENVRRALEAGASSLEEFQERLARALELDLSGLSEFERRAFETQRAWFRLLSEGAEFAASATSQYAQMLRDAEQLYADARTDAERSQALAIYDSINERRLAEIQEIQRLIAAMQQWGAAGGGLRDGMDAGSRSMNQLGGQLETLNDSAAKAAGEIGKLGGATFQMGHLAGLSLEQLEQRLRELQALTIPETPQVPTPSFGGGSSGPSRAEQVEAFQERIRGILESALDEPSRRVVETLRQIREVQAEMDRLGQATPEAERALAILREQLEATFRADRAPSLTGLAEQRDAVIGFYDEQRAAAQLWREETGEVLIARWRLDIQQQRRLRQLAESATQRLGLPLEQTRRRLDEFAETVAFLQENLDPDRWAEIKDQLGVQAFSGLLSGLADLVQDEEQRHELQKKMAQIEHTLKLAQFDLELARIKELGLLTEEQVEYLQDVRATIPDILPVTNGGGGITPYTFPNSVGNSVQQAQQAALDLLAQYQQAASSPEQSGALGALERIQDDFAIIFASLGRNADTLGAYNDAVNALTDSLLDRLRDLRDEILDVGEFSGATGREQVQSAFANAQRLVQQALSGDPEQRVAALDQVPDALRRYLQLTQSVHGAGASLLSARQWVLEVISRLTGDPSGLPGVIPGGSVDPGSPIGPGPGREEIEGLLLAGGRFGIPSSGDPLLDEVRGLRTEVRALREASGVAIEQREEARDQREELAGDQADKLEELHQATRQLATEEVRSGFGRRRLGSLAG